jgi:hypothetical protein
MGRTGGKYDPLRDYLAGSKGPELVLTFEEIESMAILHAKLPPSARYFAWWANVPQKAWWEAGWRVAYVDLDTEQVTFIKRIPGAKQTFDFFGLMWPGDADKVKIDMAYNEMINKYNPANFARFGEEFVALAKKKTNEIESKYNDALALLSALSPKQIPPKVVLIKHHR